MTVGKLPYPELGNNQNENIQILYDTVIRLRKELEYLLYHLNDDNIEFLDASKIRNLVVDSVITEVLVTQTLYAQYGFIADLTVNRLNTATFVQKYLASFVSAAGDLTFDTASITSAAGAFSKIVAGDKLLISGCTVNAGNNKTVTVETAAAGLLTFAAGTFTAGLETGQVTVKVITDVNYQRIQGEVQEFVTASTDGSATTQLIDMNGRHVYWVDATHNTGVTFDVTAFPVTIWVYTELVKRRKYFTNMNNEYIPVDELGAGAGVPGHPEWGKGYIYKLSDGLYLKYLKRTDGSEVLLKLTDDGLNLQSITQIIYPDAPIVGGGLVQLYVQPDQPLTAKVKDVWVDTDDYTRYDKTALTAVTTLTVDSNEFITASGTFNITLHAATTAGIIKKIYNIGTGIITIIGTINGRTNMNLFPSESVELITDGTAWRC